MSAQVLINADPTVASGLYPSLPIPSRVLSVVDNRFRFWALLCADLQQILFDHATNAGVEMFFKHNVRAIDETDPSVTLNNGTVFRADVVIASDGTSEFLASCM